MKNAVGSLRFLCLCTLSVLQAGARDCDVYAGGSGTGGYREAQWADLFSFLSDAPGSMSAAGNPARVCNGAAQGAAAQPQVEGAGSSLALWFVTEPGSTSILSSASDASAFNWADLPAGTYHM
jgi:hypothetical protein